VSHKFPKILKLPVLPVRFDGREIGLGVFLGLIEGESVMPSTKEPVCSQLQNLRNRLERLKASWETSASPKRSLVWIRFQQDWRERWQKIEDLLRDIEARLNRRFRGRVWDNGQPAILRFPAVEGIVSMGPF
jgi:hypothetical protein